MEVLLLLLLTAALNSFLGDFDLYVRLGLRLGESLILSTICCLISTFCLAFYLHGLNMSDPARSIMVAALYLTAFVISYQLPLRLYVYLGTPRRMPYGLHAMIVKIFPFAIAATSVAITGLI